MLKKKLVTENVIPCKYAIFVHVWAKSSFFVGFLADVTKVQLNLLCVSFELPVLFRCTFFNFSFE